MFGDSGRPVAGEGWVLCAPAPVDATDPAAATVAVFKNFLRSMKDSFQKDLVYTEAGETEAFPKLSNRSGAERYRVKQCRSPYTGWNSNIWLAQLHCETIESSYRKPRTSFLDRKSTRLNSS